jgi:methenyltetrahydrofolate cyclohydrolase
MLIEKTVKEFLDEVASSSPAPGGGSIAALCGAMASALNSMVCRLTIGKKKYAEVNDEMEDILKKTEEYRDLYTRAIDEDTEAFNKVMAAFKLPKGTEDEQKLRNEAIQKAYLEAAEIPLKVLKLSSEILRFSKTTLLKGNQNSISDAAVCCLLIQTSAVGAIYNVAINLNSIDNPEIKNDIRGRLQIYSEKIEKENEEIKKITHEFLFKNIS